MSRIKKHSCADPAEGDVKARKQSLTSLPSMLSVPREGAMHAVNYVLAALSISGYEIDKKYAAFQSET